ncbi:endonuclease/exonuclease/phosphatase family protein [Hoyosella rhizosphaerae]|uniref:Endonuclease/exonuclease/phosphatase domain-containing protein n=1 Tax=Hoyosella rhizosphaerae TaxID=1755582 RepID=A0A916UCE5_9ACTN|nr:endonuclease/exonuclease/phosphatase family protein [Hoyosella rhizosphaerae]MBN4925800.1 endonuclease/exonuclease/phosphatase family protein [Hoyosella rhizosphaerae]GGC67853.1 hypothetical protein GCM10011410_20710 [Hoyosella rhizosphaerae]
MHAVAHRKTYVAAIALAIIATVIPPAGAQSTPANTAIADIQGAGHGSPLVGQDVSGVTGIVTGQANNGFWMQDPVGDGADATSEGIFVFLGRNPELPNVGDEVAVSGTVSEYRPGNIATNLTITQLSQPNVDVVSSNNELPAPVLIGPGGRVPPAQNIAGESAFDVEKNALDFYASLESMRVQVDSPEVVGPTNRFGEIVVIPAGGDESLVRTPNGGVVYAYDRPNAMRLHLDDRLLTDPPMPSANVGDTLDGSVVGIVDYSFGNFKVQVSDVPTVNPGAAARTATRPQEADELSVASFNVENLHPGDPAEKFERLAGAIVDNLASPDIIALAEVQDNSGPANNGVVAADHTLARLRDEIRTAGGPEYQWRQIDPEDGEDGGQPGGNIRVVFFYRTDRGVEFVDRGTATATTGVAINDVDGRPELSTSPGRIAPTDEAWTSSRKPLVGEFVFREQTYFVVGNHFSSKGGDQPLFGRYQPPQRFSEQKRHAQAQLVADFTSEVMSIDPEARIIVAGDINDFEFSRTTELLEDGGAMTALMKTLPEGERYSYVYQGNAQVLDQILVSRALVEAPPCGDNPAWEYEPLRLNVDFADQISDHDPQILRLRAC